MVKRSILIVALCLATSATAQTFRWVDKDGRVQYSDRPPAGAKAEPVQQRMSAVTGTGTPAAGANASAPRSIAEQEQAFRKRQQAREEADAKQAKSEAVAKQRADTCASARGRLAGLEAGGRQARFNEKGERVFLDDSQIEQERAKLRTDINTNCG
jgi:hypothetical protein